MVLALAPRHPMAFSDLSTAVSQVLSKRSLADLPKVLAFSFIFYRFLTPPLLLFSLHYFEFGVAPYFPLIISFCYHQVMIANPLLQSSSPMLPEHLLSMSAYPEIDLACTVFYVCFTRRCSTHDAVIWPRIHCWSLRQILSYVGPSVERSTPSSLVWYGWQLFSKQHFLPVQWYS